jgi:membrane protease YdiL (CAAX protease family)
MLGGEPDVSKIVGGVALAIGITSLLDGSGLSVYSALPLIPLFALFAWLDRIPMRELGVTYGPVRFYGFALAHPLYVIGALAAAARVSGATDIAALNVSKAALNIALLSVVTFVMAIVTEEGFFRGWLWAALARKGYSAPATLAATTAAFVIWHISFVFLSSDFHFASAQIPVFFLNATLLGLIWGLLRLGSGSILVSSAGHGLWNGLTYVLFGVGSGIGALGVKDAGMFGPEVGLLGVCLNASVLVLFCILLRRRLLGHSSAFFAAA